MHTSNTLSDINFAKRLQLALERNHIEDLSALKRRLGLRQERIKAYIDGTIRPRRSIGAQLARLLKVDESWLYGEGLN